MFLVVVWKLNLNTLEYLFSIAFEFLQKLYTSNSLFSQIQFCRSDIYLEHSTPLTSSSATQHSDIYRGNSTLTLFDLILLWISCREAFVLSDAKFARLPENRSILKLSRLFPFDP